MISLTAAPADSFSLPVFFFITTACCRLRGKPVCPLEGRGADNRGLAGIDWPVPANECYWVLLHINNLDCEKSAQPFEGAGGIWSAE